MINLEKGQKINLEKEDKSKLTEFCVGCNWGAIQTSSFFGLMQDKKDVDLDLSCVMLDQNGKLIDHIYSPLYRSAFLSKYGMPDGKLTSRDGALHHTGDDLQGDTDGKNDELDNEIISVELSKVSPSVEQIFFFLNNVGNEDFSQIPYASIRMFEGNAHYVKTIFAKYNVAAEAQFAGKKALIMGKLYRHNGEWKFAAIGDAYNDSNLCLTIQRIVRDYAH